MDKPFEISNVLKYETFCSVNSQMIDWAYINKSYKDSDDIAWGQYNNEISSNLVYYKAATDIKYKIQKELKKDLVVCKMHTNAQTFGKRSNFHKDFRVKECWTFILFTELHWNTQWGGEFVCESNDGKYFYTPYIPNSGVLIPSEWEHYGSSPNVHTGQLRTTLAICYATPDSLPTLINKYPDIVNRFL